MKQDVKAASAVDKLWKSMGQPGCKPFASSTATRWSRSRRRDDSWTSLRASTDGNICDGFASIDTLPTANRQPATRNSTQGELTGAPRPRPNNFFQPCLRDPDAARAVVGW